MIVVHAEEEEEKKNKYANEEFLISFSIDRCTAVPQGSMIPHRARGKSKKIIVRHAKGADLKIFRDTVAHYAHYEMRLGKKALIEKPHAVVVYVQFFFCPSLASVRSKRKYPTLISDGGDVDKLLRAICDALTGICYDDDSQICDAHPSKRFAPSAGVRVSVYRLI
jgi:Holliday junction resolvase RusA-like endonuclease